MGILTLLSKERRSLENPSVSLSDPAIFDLLGSHPTAGGIRVSEDTATRNTAVFGCVRILAETVGSLPLILYRRVESGGKERADSNPLYRVLHDRPNREISASTFWQTMTAHLALWGNCYAEIVRDGSGRATDLWPLPPWAVQVDRSERTGTRIYRVTVSGNRVRAGGDGTRVLFEDEVFHVPGLLFDGLVGKSPIGAARQAVGLGLAMEEFGARFFGEGTRLSGVLTHPKTLSDKARSNLKKEWQALRGMDNAHRVAVLEEGLGWEQMGIPPEEAQFLESRKFQIEEIARIFRVPLVLLQHTEKATSWGTGIEQFMLAFVVHTMRPWLRNFEQEIWHDLVPVTQQQNLFAEFLVEGMLRGDAAARGEFYTKLFNIGGITINEIRARENLNPVDGGDEHFVPMNMVPLQQALEPPTSPMLQSPEPEAEEPAEDEEKEAERSAPEVVEFRVAPERQQRSLTERQRIQRDQEAVFRARAEATLARELAALRGALEEALTARDIGQFKRFLDTFYPDHESIVREEFRPVMLNMAHRIYAEAAREVGGPLAMPEELERVVESHVSAFAARESASSRGQVKEVVRNTGDDVADALEERWQEWEEKRPDKIAGRESTQGANFIVRQAYERLGVTKLRWVAAGSQTCPFCTELDGRIVGVERPFLQAGDVLGGGEAGSLSITGNRMHPPIHQGCICQIVAVGGRRSGGDPAELERRQEADRRQLEAHRNLLRTAIAWFIRRESKAARRAVKRGPTFAEWVGAHYTKESRILASRIRPIIKAHLTWCGKPEAVDAVTKAFTDEYVRQSRRGLLDAAGADDLGSAVDACVSEWENGRAAEVADALTVEEVYGA